jgi:hypothetical protein
MYSQTYYPDQRYYSFIDHMLVFHFLHPGCCWNTNYHQYGNLFSNSCDQNMVFLASHLCGKGLPILITRKGGKRIIKSDQCFILLHQRSSFGILFSNSCEQNMVFLASHLCGKGLPILITRKGGKRVTNPVQCFYLLYLYTLSVCSDLFLPFLTVSCYLTCTAMSRVR